MRVLFSRQAATVGALFVASMAFGQTNAAGDSDLSGRWAAERPKLTLDIVRCGAGWCGIEVAHGEKCGRTVLRLDSAQDHAGFVGRLEVVPGAEAYAIQVTHWLRVDDSARVLLMRGNTGGEFQLWRRTFPINTQMVRLGDPVCMESKIS